MLGPGRVSMDCSFSCYLAVTLKPKRFNSFYRSICIPDNQTGSWPWGPWRSCRAVPHTHGCSGGKPHGGLQSWIPRCPGCCCPRWGSPHPLVLTLEGSRPGQGVEEEGAGHAFPILLNTKYLNKPQEKSPVFWFFFPGGEPWLKGLIVYLVATFCQMLGHPESCCDYSVQQIRGLGCPDHWAGCSAALLL